MFRFSLIIASLLLAGPAAYAFVPAIAAIVGTSSFTSLSTMVATVGAALLAFSINFFTDETQTTKIDMAVQAFDSAPITHYQSSPEYTPFQVGVHDTSAFCTRYSRTSQNAYCNFAAFEGPWEIVDYPRCNSTNIQTFVSTQSYNCNDGSVPATQTITTTRRYYLLNDANQKLVHPDSDLLDPIIPNPLVQDNKVQIVKDGNNFVLPTDDVDYQSLQAQEIAPVIDQTGTLIARTSVGAVPTTTTLYSDSTGTTITEYQQTATNTITQTQMQVSPTGSIQSVNTTTSSGTLNPQPQSATGTVTTFQPVTATDPATQPQTSFPSDYARQGEAAQAATQITTTLLDGDVITPVVPDTDMPWFGDTFDGLSAFQINTTGATCPVWQFDALDENFYIDHHCVLIQDFNALFYAMFTAFWVLLAIRTVMEA